VALTVSGYLAGFIGLTVSLASLCWGSVSLRRAFLPGWDGAPARVAEAVILLAVSTCALQLLGLVGLISGPFVVVGAVMAGVAMWLAASRVGERFERVDLPARPVKGWMTGIAAGVTAAAFGIWMTGVQPALSLGMQGFDTLWYHGPFAARIAQTGSFLPLHFTDTQYLNWFYPENSELIHAAGISLFGYDVLSPWVGIAWLGLALVAGWAIGRPHGVQALSLVAIACVLVGSALVPRSAGNAATDIQPIALMLSAAAILINSASAARGSRGREDIPFVVIALAGLAMGVALGTKLTMLVPAFFMGAGIVGWASAGRRWKTVMVWVAAVLLPSGVWFVRNLIYSGNPFPFVSFGPLAAPDRGLEGRDPFSVSHYLFDASTAVETSFFRDGLVVNLGHLWPLIAAAGIAGIAVALVRGTSAARAVAVACLAGGLAYVFTPLTAAGPEGSPIAFEINFRYLLPSLAPALGLFVCDRIVAGESDGAKRRTWWLVAFTLLFISVILPGIGSGSGESWSEPRVSVPAALAAGFILSALAFFLPRVGSGRPGPAAIAALSVLLVIGVAGFFTSRGFVEDRYSQRVNDRVVGFTISQAARWAAERKNAEIGVAGSSGAFYQYPLYGRDLSNSVQVLGVETENGGFEAARKCRQWRRIVNAGNYGWLVISPDLDLNRPAVVGKSPEIKWVLGDRNAVYSRRKGNVWVFRLTGPLDPAGCAALKRGDGRDRPLWQQELQKGEPTG
jgi:hypothetical protein